MCCRMVDEKIRMAEQSLLDFQQAANEETKSSAGDKYETARAMMHLEKEKVASMLNESLKLKKTLSLLNPDRRTEAAEMGSLVQTGQGLFFISVSVGKLRELEDVICLSPVSPLGKAFLGKQKGDTVSFNGQDYTMLAVC